MTVQIAEVWSDIDHRFIEDGQGLLKKVINADSVRTSIDNILRTYPGERVMLPEFGSNLRSMLFEGIDSTFSKLLSREIKETIELWDDRVLIESVEISVDPDSSLVTIAASFTIRGYGDIFKYTTTIKGQ